MICLGGGAALLGGRVITLGELLLPSVTSQRVAEEGESGVSSFRAKTLESKEKRRKQKRIAHHLGPLKYIKSDSHVRFNNWFKSQLKSNEFRERKRGEKKFSVSSLAAINSHLSQKASAASATPIDLGRLPPRHDCHELSRRAFHLSPSFCLLLTPGLPHKLCNYHNATSRHAVKKTEKTRVSSPDGGF